MSIPKELKDAKYLDTMDLGDVKIHTYVINYEQDEAEAKKEKQEFLLKMLDIAIRNEKLKKAKLKSNI